MRYTITAKTEDYEAEDIHQHLMDLGLEDVEVRDDEDKLII